MAPRKPKFDAAPAPQVVGAADVQTDKVPEAEVPGVKEAKVGKFAGKTFSFFHPFQRVCIPAGGPGVTLEIDSWLQCQIDAGFIVKL